MNVLDCTEEIPALVGRNKYFRRRDSWHDALRRCSKLSALLWKLGFRNEPVECELPAGGLVSLENAGDKAIDTGFRLVEGFDDDRRENPGSAPPMMSLI